MTKELKAGYIKWVRCPLCKEPDMRATFDGNADDPTGHGWIVLCVNLACPSNIGPCVRADVAEGQFRAGLEQAAKVAEDDSMLCEIRSTEFSAKGTAIRIAAAIHALATPPPPVTPQGEECQTCHHPRSYHAWHRDHDECLTCFGTDEPCTKFVAATPSPQPVEEQDSTKI